MDAPSLHLWPYRVQHRLEDERRFLTPNHASGQQPECESERIAMQQPTPVDHLNAVLAVFNAALESVPPQTRKILLANAQAPLNALGTFLETAKPPEKAM